MANLNITPASGPQITMNQTAERWLKTLPLSDNLGAVVDLSAFDTLKLRLLDSRGSSESNGTTKPHPVGNADGTMDLEITVAFAQFYGGGNASGIYHVIGVPVSGDNEQILMVGNYASTF